MQYFAVVVLAFAALTATASAAPAQLQAEIEALLAAEAQDTDKVAKTEQQNLRELVGFISNQTLRLVKNLFQNGPRGELLSSEEMAQIEQNGLLDLLGGLLGGGGDGDSNGGNFFITLLRALISTFLSNQGGGDGAGNGLGNILGLLSGLGGNTQTGSQANTESLSSLTPQEIQDLFNAEERAKIEQANLRGLLGSILDSANNYAQEKLSGSERGRGGAFRGFLGSVLNGVNHYAQSKLQPSSQSLPTPDNTGLTPQEVLDLFSDEEMAEMEQTTLRELAGSLLNSANRFTQGRLSGDRRSGSGRNLLGNVLTTLTDFAQERLTQPNAQAVIVPSGTAFIPREQEEEKEAAKKSDRAEAESIFTQLPRPVLPRPVGATDTDMARGMSEDEEEARLQALSAILTPILTSAAGALFSNFLSQSGSSTNSNPSPSSSTSNYLRWGK